MAQAVQYPISFGGHTLFYVWDKERANIIESRLVRALEIKDPVASVCELVAYTSNEATKVARREIVVTITSRSGKAGSFVGSEGIEENIFTVNQSDVDFYLTFDKTIKNKIALAKHIADQINLVIRDICLLPEDQQIPPN